jgi:hypothetical protein
MRVLFLFFAMVMLALTSTNEVSAKKQINCHYIYTRAKCNGTNGRCEWSNRKQVCTNGGGGVQTSAPTAPTPPTVPVKSPTRRPTTKPSMKPSVRPSTKSPSSKFN